MMLVLPWHKHQTRTLWKRKNQTQRCHEKYTTVLFQECRVLFFFPILGIVPKASGLPGKHSTTWVPPPGLPLPLWSAVLITLPQLDSHLHSCFHLSSSWEYRCVVLHSAKNFEKQTNHGVLLCCPGRLWTLGSSNLPLSLQSSWGTVVNYHTCLARMF
jgi:hypothetical protein